MKKNHGFYWKTAHEVLSKNIIWFFFFKLFIWHLLTDGINSNRIEPPITVFILLFGWICHWQRLVILCPQCTNITLDCHWSHSVTWLNPQLLIGQLGFVGSFLYNWSKSNFIKNNNIEFNCLYFSYLVDGKWCQASVQCCFCHVSCGIFFHSFFSL